ncbi:MAG: hypothetical protein WCK35_25905, partial [Chloroflexota bacterium]
MNLPETENIQEIKTIIREMPSDLDTPISIYLKLRDENPSFLLESVEGGERIARYSFIGIKPYAQYILRDRQIQIITGSSVKTVQLEPGTDPTMFLQKELSQYKSNPNKELPRFIGGLVGYMSYETIRHFEPTLNSKTHATGLPDAHYLLADTIIAFDHARRSLFLITNVVSFQKFMDSQIRESWVN